MKRALVAGLLGAATVTPFAPSTAAAQVPTCRGIEATHVGTPGQHLRTSPGPDVVVTNGAGMVQTRAGDDIICVTGEPDVRVYPGRGDDLVDAVRYQGYFLRTYLGADGVAGSSGDDLYLGGERNDRVFVFSGNAGDSKVIRTEGEEDVLKVGQEYAGQLTADLGGDSDEYTVNVPRTGLTVDGGPGHDFLDSECRGCDAAEFDLATGAIRADGEDAGTALGFGALYVENRRLPEISVVGTDRPNSIIVHACHGELVGGGRNDLLVVHGANPSGCAAPSAALWGGGGDDTLDGTRGDDVIIGGTGVDTAYGDEGVDTCDTERKRDCEN